MRRWNYDIYYDENGDITTAEAIDVTINDDYDIVEEHNRYECQLDEDGAPLVDETDTPLPA